MDGLPGEKWGKKFDYVPEEKGVIVSSTFTHFLSSIPRFWFL